VQASVAAYIDAVIAGQEPPIAGAAAVETMRLLHRIYDSAVVLHDGSGPQGRWWRYQDRMPCGLPKGPPAVTAR
jgi:hypothetical protein